MVAGFSTNIGTDCLFDIKNPEHFYSIVSSSGAHVPIALKEKNVVNLTKELASAIQHHIVYHDRVIIYNSMGSEICVTKNQ